jgi:hypothetical protein
MTPHRLAKQQHKHTRKSFWGTISEWSIAVLLKAHANERSAARAWCTRFATVFDHTSILKTILVRHRNNLPSEAFTSFGERVNKANHLGIALDLDNPRTDPPLPLPMAAPQTNVWDPAHRTSPMYPADGDTTDFHAALCRAMLPIPRPQS